MRQTYKTDSGKDKRVDLPRFTLPFRKTAAETALAPELPPAPAVSGPPLLVLLPRSGVTSFAVHPFHEAREACDFLQAVFEANLGLPTGTLAFWALQEAPAVLSDALEPVVLIRNADNADVGCPYFFTDVPASQSYAGTKIRQGITPDHISLYRALLVEITLDDQGMIALSPTRPPTPLRSANAAAGHEFGPPDDGLPTLPQARPAARKVAPRV